MQVLRTLTLSTVFLLTATMTLACTSDSGMSEDGTTPQPDAAVSAGDPDASLVLPDAMPGGALNFMDPCDLADDQCDSAAGDLCFSFNNAGPHCTHACTIATSDTDCPAPSRGCNNMGVCKSP